MLAALANKFGTNRSEPVETDIIAALTAEHRVLLELHKAISDAVAARKYAAIPITVYTKRAAMTAVSGLSRSAACSDSHKSTYAYAEPMTSSAPFIVLTSSKEVACADL